MSTKIKIVAICTGILVGTIVTAQFRTVTPQASSFPLDQLEAQQELIESYTNEQALLKSKIVSLREKIADAQEKSQSISQTANLDILSNLKEKVGLEVKKGQGYQIYLDDKAQVDRTNVTEDELGIVYASDLRDLINLIKASGASGIAINNQRVINTTSINSVGNTILVDNFNLVPPFEISVIGDGDVYMQYFDDSTMLDDLKKRINNNGLIYSVKKLDLITLPIYNGQLRLNHLNSIENEA